MFKPIFWIFFGGGVTIIGGAITLIATYKHNLNSSARNERIEGGIKDANAKADTLLSENKGLKADLSNTQQSIEVQEQYIRELSGKLDPFIELAKSKHPGKSEDDALKLLRKELKKVADAVKETKDKYIPKVTDFKVIENNVPTVVYRDANKASDATAGDFGVATLYRSTLEVNYKTELKRTDVTFELTNNKIVAGYVDLLTGGTLMYIRTNFNDNGNCAFHIYNPDNGTYRFTFYTTYPNANAKLNWFDDSVKVAPN